MICHVEGCDRLAVGTMNVEGVAFLVCRACVEYARKLAPVSMIPGRGKP